LRKQAEQKTKAKFWMDHSSRWKNSRLRIDPWSIIWILQLYTNIHPKEVSFQRVSEILHYTKFLSCQWNFKKVWWVRLINKKLPSPKKLLRLKKKNNWNFTGCFMFIESRNRSRYILQWRRHFILWIRSRIIHCSIQHVASLSFASRILYWFMMFKNGYPMAYGGGWLFGKRSLLGINIFESFRGGESAFVFAQLLRTYKNALALLILKWSPINSERIIPKDYNRALFGSITALVSGQSINIKWSRYSRIWKDPGNQRVSYPNRDIKVVY